MQLFYVACTIVRPTVLSVFVISPLSVQTAHIFRRFCVLHLAFEDKMDPTWDWGGRNHHFCYC